MRIKNTEIIDTFAEAFEMWAARVVITADSPEWAQAAAQSMTGFATSVISCKCEAGVETVLEPADTPDGRPGIAVLLFTMDSKSMIKRLVERIGQCVMTCPTTACFNGLESEDTVPAGGQLRYFGDSYQSSKLLDDRRYWRIPVMEGEFLIDEKFGMQPAVGGGNLLILGRQVDDALPATTAAVDAMRNVSGVILPFPNGVVRCGSKPGSSYKGLMASTNEAYCPTLRGIAPHSSVPEDVNAVFEIVIDGLDEASVGEAMRLGAQAAATAGAVQISAGNYGGNLGKYKFDLHKLLAS